MRERINSKETEGSRDERRFRKGMYDIIVYMGFCKKCVI
jgi:hypothetical protein